MAWQTIVKAIGGAMSGAANGLNKMNATEAPGTSNNIDTNAEQNFFNTAKSLGSMGANMKLNESQPVDSKETNSVKTIDKSKMKSMKLSDENEKSICEMLPAISDCYKNIEAYIFKYKPEAQSKFSGTFGVDDNPHVGIIAQELQSNPATAATVHPLTDGTLTVNANELAMTNAAAIADLSRRLEQLEKTIGERND